MNKSKIEERLPEPQSNQGTNDDDTSVSPSIAKPNVICRLSFYTLPFHKSKYSGWVWDNAGNFVFQFESEFDNKGNYAEGWLDMEEKIIQSLNSETHCPIPELKLTLKNSIEIFNGNKMLILIRGWGGLTGVGKHNFDGEKAAKIQDDFAKWIMYKLSPLEAVCTDGI